MRLQVSPPNLGSLVLKSKNLAADLRRKSSPPKKRRLSSPLSDLTSLASSLPPSSIHQQSEIDDAEMVPTSQSDEQELTLPEISKKDAAEVQESVDRWRQKTLMNPPSRSGSVSDYDRFGSPLSDLPIDGDENSFADGEPVPETPVSEVRSDLGLPTPQTPSSRNHGAHQIASSSTLATPASHTVSRRKAPSPDASPSDAFRSLTPPPSSDMDIEPEPDDMPNVEVLDVKSKTEKIIADIKARAIAAAHSSPEQSPIDLDALSDDSDSSDDSDAPGGLVAALIKDAQNRKSKASVVVL